jgi:ABC-type multidrug transport system ATPase subunit
MQGNSTCPEQTVDEHLTLCLRLNKFDVEESARTNLLSYFGLSQRRHDRIGWLSGGLRRRLNLAAAFGPALASSEPIIILLDEPSVGLDDAAILKLHESINTLKKSGHGILLSTHDDSLLSLCNRVFSVDDGLLSEENIKSDSQIKVPPVNVPSDGILSDENTSGRDEVDEVVETPKSSEESGSESGVLSNDSPPSISAHAKQAKRANMLFWNAKLDMRTLSTPIARIVPALLAMALYQGLKIETSGINADFLIGLILAPALIAALVRPSLSERLSFEESGVHFFAAFQQRTAFQILLACSVISPAVIAIAFWILLAPTGWSTTAALWVAPLAALIMVDVSAAAGLIHIRLGGANRRGLGMLLLLPFAWVLLMLVGAISASLDNLTTAAIKGLAAALAMTWMMAGLVLVIRE